MPLPMSKTALDRLGARLATHDPVSDADYASFLEVASFYQDVLNGVTAQLAALGFTAATRIKTTPTLAGKLRRQHTRLSQVQDLAGARFTVLDRRAQDAAVKAIIARYKSLGCPCKEDDLRDDPSHGYRAVHVIVQVDSIPVEIQVRTELQDAWAQIVENLADRWGRGIRYGDEPEQPGTIIRSAGLTLTREAAIGVLKTLSDTIAQHEEARARIDMISEAVIRLDDFLERTPRQVAQAGIGDEDLLRDIRPDIRAPLISFGEITERLRGDESRALMSGWRDGTFAGLITSIQGVTVVMRENADRASTTLHGTDRQLRDMLRLIAEATDGQG
jgi:ppGpp synthetase/RelA/SpoT-type nucleotidyltranferase